MSKPQPPINRGFKCPNGHDDWRSYELSKRDGSPLFRCLTCKEGTRRSHWSTTKSRGGAVGTLLYDTLTYSEVMKARGEKAA